MAIRFGKYTLSGRIAVGGMAEVFLARVTGAQGFSKAVALKRILPQLANDIELAKLFIDEAKLSAQLVHPNIVQVYELAADDNVCFIVMEYVQGTDLAQLRDFFARSGARIPPQLLLAIADAVLAALAYAHDKRDENGTPLDVVHRDLSPANVLVSNEGVIKLADFGIAKAASRLTQTATGFIRGKYAYMAPEQASGLNVDPRTDIFGLGLVLYELLGGQRAYAANSDLGLLEEARRAEMAPLGTLVSDLPRSLVDAVMRALAKDPADRWASADAFRGALREAAESLGPPLTRQEIVAWVEQAPQRAIETLWAPPSDPSPEATPKATAVAVATQNASPSPERGANPTAKRRGWLLLASLPLVAAAALTLRLSHHPVAPVTLVDGPASLPSPALTPAPVRAPPDPVVPATAYGYLGINSRPWSYVFVDGQRLAKTTPIQRHKLTEGRHQIRLFCPELNREQVFVAEIKRDEIFTKVVVFTKD